MISTLDIVFPSLRFNYPGQGLLHLEEGIDQVVKTLLFTSVENAWQIPFLAVKCPLSLIVSPFRNMSKFSITKVGTAEHYSMSEEVIDTSWHQVCGGPEDVVSHMQLSIKAPEKSNNIERFLQFLWLLEGMPAVRLELHVS